MNELSASDQTNHRFAEAVWDYALIVPRKWQKLLTLKPGIAELRRRGASYQAITEILRAADVPVSRTAVARFCRRVERNRVGICALHSRVECRQTRRGGHSSCRVACARLRRCQGVPITRCCSWLHAARHRQPGSTGSCQVNRLLHQRSKVRINFRAGDVSTSVTLKRASHGGASAVNAGGAEVRGAHELDGESEPYNRDAGTPPVALNSASRN
jgi:hypothetical protein